MCQSDWLSSSEVPAVPGGMWVWVTAIDGGSERGASWEGLLQRQDQGLGVRGDPTELSFDPLVD